MRRVLPLAIALVVLATPDAAADGLPIVDYGVRPDEIGLRDGRERLALLPAGERRTAVARFEYGYVRRSALLPGTWAIPAVAYDGTAGGASADGRTYTLITPRKRFPRKTTELALLGRDLSVKRRIDLEGDFSFDAISPDGSALFLVEYPDRRDPSVYRVRVYDVAAARLLPKPLIDSKTAAIVMRGLPVTRATGRGGDVEYTLYDGLGDPFIHALDTAQRSALCIPLPQPRTRNTARYGLEVGLHEIVVTDRQGTFAVVDTESNTASKPEPAPWISLTTALSEMLRASA